MQLSGTIPKALQHAARKHAHAIESICNEGTDGLWIYLLPGYWNAEGQVTAIHERTARDAINMLRYIKPDPRPVHQR